MSGCSQREWAIAAAEVQAMFQSREIFADRIDQFKAAEEKQCPDQERLPSKSEGRMAPLPFGAVCRLYEALIVERVKEKRFYPKAKGFGHLQAKLDLYAPVVED